MDASPTSMPQLSTLHFLLSIGKKAVEVQPVSNLYIHPFQREALHTLIYPRETAYHQGYDSAKYLTKHLSFYRTVDRWYICVKIYMSSVIYVGCHLICYVSNRELL